MRPENENGRPRQGAPISSNVLNLDTSEDNRARQRTALRRALHDAQRRQDRPSVALLQTWLREAA